MDHHDQLTLVHTHRDILIRLAGSPHHATLPALTIRTYLPAAAAAAATSSPHRHFARRGHHTLDLDAYITASTPVRHNLLRPSKTLRVLRDLVDILAETSHSHAPPPFSLGDPTDPAAPLLTDALARAQLEDRRAGAAAGTRCPFPRTLATFVVLADVSRTFASRRIGAVLASFFLAHCGGERVLGGPGGEQAVLLWAWAVVVARMRESERAACLGEIVRARPDVVGRRGFAAWVGAVVPDGGEVVEAVGRAVEREGVGLRRAWGDEEGDGDAGGVYLHERRERRVVRGAGAGVGRPLDLETYHRARRLVEPEDLVPWKVAGSPALLRGYGGGGGGGGGGGRSALDSIRNDQRELRFDMHDVRDELDELAQQIDKLGRRDRDVGRRGRMAWRDRDVVDSSERWPEKYESEWISEWWDDCY